jgi:hypothetical protein
VTAPTPPTGVAVKHPPHNPECWVLPVGARTVLWRFWPAADGKVPHGPFVTFEGSLHGPVTAEDMDRLAAAAAAVAERIRADHSLAVDDQPVLFTREVA